MLPGTRRKLATCAQWCTIQVLSIFLPLKNTENCHSDTVVLLFVTLSAHLERELWLKKRIVSVFPPQSHNCSSAVWLLAVFFEFTPCSADRLCVFECVLRKRVKFVLVFFYSNEITTITLGVVQHCLPATSAAYFEMQLNLAVFAICCHSRCHVRESGQHSAFALEQMTIEVWTFHPPNISLKESCSSVGTVVKTHS